MSPYTKQKFVLRLPAEADADGPGLHLQSLGYRERRERHPSLQSSKCQENPRAETPSALSQVLGPQQNGRLPVCFATAGTRVTEQGRGSRTNTKHKSTSPLSPPLQDWRLSVE